MRIFVAGPLTNENPFVQTGNIEQAMAVGAALMALGHQPFVPHLSQHWDEYVSGWSGSGFPYERWMAWCLEWLSQCNAIVYLGPSPGADRELAFAEELGLKVYRGLDEVPSA